MTDDLHTRYLAATLLDRLADALRECSDDLAAEISARYEGTLHYPVQQRGYDRDMEPVERARALLAELAAIDAA